MKKIILLTLTSLLAFTMNAQQDDFYKKLGSNCPNVPLELFFDKNNDLHSVSFANDTIFVHQYDSANGTWGLKRFAPHFGMGVGYDEPSNYAKSKKILPFYLKDTLYISISHIATNQWYRILKESGSDTFKTVIQEQAGWINDLVVYNDTAYLGGTMLFPSWWRHLGKFDGTKLDSIPLSNSSVIMDLELVNDTLYAIDGQKCYTYNIGNRISAVYYDFGPKDLIALTSFNGGIYIGSSSNNYPVYHLSKGQLLDTILNPVPGFKTFDNYRMQEFMQHDGKLYQIFTIFRADKIGQNYGLRVLQNKAFKSIVPPNHINESDSFIDFSGVLVSNGIHLYYIPRVKMEANGDTLNIAQINPDSIQYFLNDTIFMQAFVDNDSTGDYSIGDTITSGSLFMLKDNWYEFQFSNASLNTFLIPDFMEVSVGAFSYDKCFKLPFSGKLKSDNLQPGKTRDTLLFPFRPKITSSKIKGTLYLTHRARLNDTIQNVFKIEETGCPISSKQVYARIILAKNTKYISSNPALNKKLGDTLNFTKSFVDVYNPLNWSFKTSYSNTDFKIGDSVIHFLEIFSDSTFLNQISRDSLLTRMGYSYDPNIKTCQPSGIVTKDFDKVRYTIHFENEGNDVARKVIIKDTIDTRLPALYFQMMGSSHPYDVTIQNNIVTWTFNNINLKGKSEDPKASRGWVAFEIKVNTPLAIGDSVRNKAGIYFDLNEPIITNYAMVRREKLKVNNDKDFIRVPTSKNLLVYPNPATNKVTFKNLLSTAVTVNIYNVLGSQMATIVLTEKDGLDYDISHLSKGMYLLKIAETGESFKLLVE